MSEPLDRARRVVATGACVLALVIGTLGAAAWRLVETETADAAVRGRSAAALAAEDLVRALVAEGEDRRTEEVEVTDDGAMLNPSPPQAFDAMPPLADPEGAFYVREAEVLGGTLARAALRRATLSTDPATRLAAAATGARIEIAEGTGRAADWVVDDLPRTPPLGQTKDAVLLRLVRPPTYALDEPARRR